MIEMNEIKELKYYKYPLNTYAKIYSLNGAVDEISIIAEGYYGNQKVYITKYKDIKCTSIFNPFVCDYYTDDKFGLIKE